MCGIIAYKGTRKAADILLDGLKRLEYRGYDSCGMAIISNNRIETKKDVGRIAEVDKKLNFLKMNGNIGVSHTRWSTTGSVTQINSHPHLSCDRKIAVVHNGVIENYTELKKELVKKGHKFTSETDTEVIAHLIEEDSSFERACLKTFKKIQGRNAFVAMNDKGEMVVAKNGSPLVIGIGSNEYFVASDAPAFIKHTRKIIFVEDGELISLGNAKDQEIRFIDTRYSKDLKKRIQEIEWNVEEAQKGKYPHFLIKEIMDQKKTIMAAATQDYDKIEKIADMINESFGSFLIACGTAGHAALASSYFFSKIANKHINHMVASEFQSHYHFLTDKSLVIAISQSGETADVLEAVKKAKTKSAKIVGIVNVPGSSLARQSNYAFMTNAGPEIAVCSTKAYTSQLSVALLLAYAAAGKMDEGVALLKQTANLVDNMLNQDLQNKTKQLAKKLADKDHIYVLGKGFNYPTSLETALKIKEVSYIHAEGFASGELKHGVIALIEKDTPCIVIVANDDTKQDVLTAALEVKSRGGYIIGISPENNEIFDYWLKVPDAGNASPIVNTIPSQLLAYYLSIERGCDPDYCRNLAKAVTVL
ncbi:MAG: glutamine--fructose-6-phosphate transaminase (isomerizing) [Candidatus Aenigmarchaeota archaeon]|nr:glutamine--fructose-6-phosphate transaminase (isomerizing) [Candidatus Aenigmarchaeota archaeon]